MAAIVAAIVAGVIVVALVVSMVMVGSESDDSKLERID
jgi:hypothetical protein